MEQSTWMFMFDNAAGWVHENAPYSDKPYVVHVRWLGSRACDVERHFDSQFEMDAYLDRVAEVTDDRG